MRSVQRGKLVLGLAGLLAGGMPGCFILRCEDSFHGISGSQRFSATILGPHTRPSGTSCGEVGDLPAGTTLAYTARPDGPGDGCDDHLDLEVTALSSGTVSETTITLPNGCTATWRLEAHPLRDDTDFLSNDLERPRWYIERYMANLSAECAPGATPPSSCTDYFIASATR